MSSWLESLGALGLAGLGIGLGLGAARLRRPWWTLGYFAPLAVIVSLRLARHWPAFGLLPPVFAIASGGARYAALSLAIPMIFTTLIARLKSPSKRALAGAFAFVAVAFYGIGPLVAPALVRARLLAIPTTFDEKGVCLQQTGYTCGPAAAVTGLRALGLEAEEGEIAVLSRTSPCGGTQAASLCAALRKRYAADGLSCRYRSFESVAELGDCCPVLAFVKFAPLVDHWVAVLEVRPDRVVIGDPARGLRQRWRGDFEKLWRGTGIVLRREGKARCVGKSER